MPRETGSKGGFAEASQALYANNDSMLPIVPDLAHHELRGEGRADPGEIVNKIPIFFERLKCVAKC